MPQNHYHYNLIVDVNITAGLCLHGFSALHCCHMIGRLDEYMIRLNIWVYMVSHCVALKQSFKQKRLFTS